MKKEFDFSVRRQILARRKERPKCIHKTWVDFPTGAMAVVSALCIAVQLILLAFLYAFFAYMFPIFWYVSFGLTFCAAVHVFICEQDAQSKSSWLFLFLVSFGCGYIVYILADKRVCYGYNKGRFSEIFRRSAPHIGTYSLNTDSAAVSNDCEYMYNSGGFVPYDGTDVKYYSDGREFFNNLIDRLDKAEKFIFIEYFIVSDGVLLERFTDVLKRKVAEGVEVRMLYDDNGSRGVFSAASKRRLKQAGVKLKVFASMISPFTFALNYRDHRKIVVVDGKTGYVGGCNIADGCVNQHRMDGFWKDAGLRLDGAAVDGLSLTFMRQWELATREKFDFAEYLRKYEKTQNGSTVVPYAGGPEIEEALCRGVYANMISGARKKLYIMTPYFIPDGDIINRLKAKAQSGVDVRLVLPAVPDYPPIYLITRSNAERLIKYGVKIYFVRNSFVHSKVMLTENCVTVGSVNMDMRAFYQEFDNGVYTDDKGVMEAAQADFESAFVGNLVTETPKHNFFVNAATAILRIVSPLM